MAICSAGHPTNQTDFCDTCGLPVPTDQSVLSESVLTATPSLIAPSALTCPNCGVGNVAEALFCEACGYDFTTAAMVASPSPRPWLAPVPSPEVSEPAPLGVGSVTNEAPIAQTPADQQPTTSAPTPEWPKLVAVADPPPPADEQPVANPESVAASESATPAPVSVIKASSDSNETAQQVLEGESLQPAPQSSPEASIAPAPGSVIPPQPAVDWVAELWIDPDWYAAQGSTDPMPSVGLPDIVPLVKPGNLVGRVSHSKGIFPEIDCELDTGCSRRHAMVTTDWSRWWIEDLNSANGTFVGSAAGPLPGMPIPQGRVELASGQRIYVGAWTRIVIRKATDDEREAFAI